jgi:hypothetical protein
MPSAQILVLDENVVAVVAHQPARPPARQSVLCQLRLRLMTSAIQDQLWSQPLSRDGVWKEQAEEDGEDASI